MNSKTNKKSGVHTPTGFNSDLDLQCMFCTLFHWGDVSVASLHNFSYFPSAGSSLLHPPSLHLYSNMANCRHEPKHVQAEARLALFIAPPVWCIWRKRLSNRRILQCAFCTWLSESHVTREVNMFGLIISEVTQEKNEPPLPAPGSSTQANPPLTSESNGACWRRDGSGGGGGRGGGVSNQEGCCVVSTEGEGGRGCSSLLLRQCTSQGHTGPFRFKCSGWLPAQKKNPGHLKRADAATTR